MAFGRIASRYSKSLLEIAQGNNELDKVKADMDAVQQICMNSKDLISLLNNPIVKTADKKAVLQKIFASLGKTTQSFISFLVDRNREATLPMVAENYIKAYNTLKGINKATVTSAIPLSKETLTKLENYTKGILGLTEVELDNQIDPSIIGGIIIKHEDKLLDLSVSKELREIRKTLIYN
jgi:F-type H+-transporting ATPase subunit delta